MNQLAVILGLALVPAVGNLIGGLIAHEDGSDIKASAIAIAFFCGLVLFVSVTAGLARWAG